eukprot:Hpha_TRINITY_DN4372_c0_g1::TRINITY_DN4372_c0_g1_i1::g.50183::m.50183
MTLMLFGRLACGEAFCLEVPADGTVHDLKRAIFEHGGPPPHLQNLTCAGAELVNDTIALADSGISAEAEVGIAESRARQPRLTGAQGYALAALNGGLKAWGRIKTSMLPLPSGVHVVGAVAGYFHVVALLADGKCLGWDTSRNGTWAKAERDPVPDLRGQRALHIGAGQRFSVALLEDNTISVSALPGSQLQVPDFSGQKIESISVCETECLVLTEEGKVRAIRMSRPGYTRAGVVDPPDFGDQKVTHISLGDGLACAIVEGQRAVCWGNHAGSGEQVVLGVVEEGGDPDEYFVEVAAASSGVIGLTNRHRILQWGRTHEPPPDELLGEHVEAVGAGSNFFMALLPSGKVVSWNKSMTDKDSIKTS